MPEHPTKNSAAKQTKSKAERHAERPTGMLEPGSKGQLSTPRIGTTTGPAKRV